MLDFTTFREQTSYHEEIDALAEQYDINHRIAKRVKEEFGISLEWEIKILGK